MLIVTLRSRSAYGIESIVSVRFLLERIERKNLQWLMVCAWNDRYNAFGYSFFALEELPIRIL